MTEHIYANEERWCSVEEYLTEQQQTLFKDDAVGIAWTLEDYKRALSRRLADAKFPYRTKDDAELVNDFLDLCYTDEKYSLAGYTIGMEMHDSLWHVQCGEKGHKCAFDNWSAKTVERAVNMQTTKITLYTLRSLVSLMLGGQKPSQFRPALARNYYKRYVKNNDIIVDPSAGWGGRMLGWLSIGYDGQFIGIDPSPESNKGNEKILRLLNFRQEVNYNYIKLVETPFEDWNPEPKYLNNIGFIITSPPYFNIEKYAGEDQSYIRYPTLNGWLDVFMRKYIQQCYNLLAPQRYFVLNIGRVGEKREDVSDVIKQLILDAGFILEEVVNEVVATGFGELRGRGEPFYICKKDTEEPIVKQIEEKEELNYAEAF